jgi:signal-transduction protein with cAMP-binding, CBS, and nucleotidyltransferase domain
VKVSQAIRRSGVGIEAHRTVGEAAGIMDQAGVGALAVVDGHQVIGMITDRDLVRRAMAKGLPLDTVVESVMSRPVVAIDAEADLHEAFAMFRANAIRRLAVVARDRFVGVITIDDLLLDLAQDLVDLARPVTTEVFFADRGRVTAEAG